LAARRLTASHRVLVPVFPCRFSSLLTGRQARSVTV